MKIKDIVIDKELKIINSIVKKKYGFDILDECIQHRLFDYLSRYDEKANEIFKNFPIAIDKGYSERKIYTMWLQGIENMPDIVKACVRSMEKLGYTLEVLTNENINQYIELPEFITKKYNENVITRVEYSNIVRTAVLYKYGGCWVDSTVFINESVPDYMVKDFFVFKRNEETKSCRRYANWWISCEKNEEILKRVLSYYFAFFQSENRQYSYFIYHVIWYRVETLFPKCREKLEEMPIVFVDETHCLQKKLNEIYSGKAWEIIKKNSVVSKCTYKKQYINDENTFYYKLINGELG